MMLRLKEILTVVNDYRKKRKLDDERYKEFYTQFEEFNALAAASNKASKEFLYPCLYDNTALTAIEPIYFYQDSWAFENIYNSKPRSHIDVGSQHTFVAHLSKVVDLTMVDIRPLSLPMDSIKFIKGSILNLPFKDETIDSLSSMCVIEHIGLGRYGDPIDPEGSEKSFKDIDRVLKSGSNFYFSVPVEPTNKVYFNAHRAFNEDYLLEHILGNYDLVSRKYIYGDKFTDDIQPQFGVGCYHVRKRSQKQ